MPALSSKAIRIANRRVSRTTSAPSPVRGLNARDSLAAMKETDAIVLDNWFPEPSYVAVRNGSVAHATNPLGPVESIMSYNGPTARTVFAAASGGFYNVTTAGNFGAAVVSGLTNARWEHVNFANSGGNFLIAVNGVDTWRQFDGASWSSPATTGTTSDNFFCIAVYKRRIFVGIRNSLRFGYLGSEAISGAVSVFDLGPIFKLGGKLQAITTWSVDTSSELGDYIAFLTSEGEVAVYQGIDPGDAATWRLVSVFRQGRPIGVRCCQRLASDVVVITADGLIPLSQALVSDRSRPNYALTDRIHPLINTDVLRYAGLNGWQVMFHPTGRKVIINVPEIGGISHQYVMNSVTQSWCRFTGWNALCFEVSGDTLFYGGAVGVRRADVGLNDAGASILVDCKPAFSYFGSPGLQKHFKMSRPILDATAVARVQLDINVDYEDRARTTTVTTVGTAGVPWGSPWGSEWAGGAKLLKDWQSTPGIGYAVTARIKAYVKDIGIRWLSTDYVYEVGGVL